MWRVAVGLVIAVSISCGAETTSEPSSAPPGGSVELAFGLEVVEGSEPIGRPAIFDQAAFFYAGEPVHARKLHAAFWVISDDPVSVVRAWVDQLDHLALDQVTVQRGTEGPAHWIQVTGMTDPAADQPSGDWADLQLWATSRRPLLLVRIDKIRGDPQTPAVKGDPAKPPKPESGIAAALRHEGDALFTEQGDTLHLPVGSEALIPTIPTRGGTGGSTSVLSAPDAADAVGALLTEAAALNAQGEVTGPEESTTNNVHVVTGSFVIPAGGWGFDVVAVQADDDSLATVYITSYAD